MANTGAQQEAEKWVRQYALPQVFGKTFEKRSLILRGGGEFAFDAVSRDGEIVAVISTSTGMTASGKKGTAKLLKIRSDVLWFYMLCDKPVRSVLVFTDPGMKLLVEDQIKCCRFPNDFEIVQVDLPLELAEKVRESQRLAAEEVRPRKS